MIRKDNGAGPILGTSMLTLRLALRHQNLAKEANEVSTGSGSDRVNVGASVLGVTRSLPLAVLTQSSSFQFR